MQTPAAPPKWEPAEYTQHFVREAIRKYQTDGLDATLDFYNTQESIDGQWYVFIFDENDMMLAHAANPAFVGLHASDVDGPNTASPPAMRWLRLPTKTGNGSATPS